MRRMVTPVALRTIAGKQPATPSLARLRFHLLRAKGDSQAAKRLAEEFAESSNASKVVQASRSFISISKKNWAQPTVSEIYSATTPIKETTQSAKTLKQLRRFELTDSAVKRKHQQRYNS